MGKQMQLELASAVDFGLDRTVKLLNKGFTDYYLRIELDLPSFFHLIVQDSIDLASSQVAVCDGAAVGVALIARRGWTCRLAGMALVPEARGMGIGSWFVRQLIKEAQDRGERRMVLEVIEQNTAGVRLYQSVGFETTRRLLSFNRAETNPGSADELDDVDLRELGRIVMVHGLPDLPWQVSGETLALLGPPNRAYRLESAFAAISNPTAPRIAIHSIITQPEARKTGQAGRLMRAIMTKHPDKAWIVPALCPEEIRGLFEKLGFGRGELAQHQMELVWERSG
jgi:ribosomal protein S18 acetylase RimI-like enzyme